MPEPKKDFTPTEVAVLVESFRHDIRLIAEDTSSIKEDMTDVKSRLGNLEVKVQSLDDAVRLSLPRIARPEAKIGA